MSNTVLPPILIADDRGVDFLNSIAAPAGAVIDWISDGQGFLDWLVASQLVAGDVVRDLQALASPGELDAVADQARRLREWFRAFAMTHKGRPLVATDLEALSPLSRLLERDDAFWSIRPSGEVQGAAFTLQNTRRWRSPELLLQPVGMALARLVCDQDFTHLKACAGQGCTLLFVDRTRGHARRWCSMAACGNRAKQATHRHRSRPGST